MAVVLPGQPPRSFRSPDLRCSRLQIGTAFDRLLHGIIHGNWWSGRKRNIVSDVVVVISGKPREPSQIDLLAREVVFKRREPLLLHQLLHLAAIHIDLR